MTTWEPWTPEVGQRVRLRMTTECRYCRPDVLTLDGQPGVVEDIGHGPAPTTDPDWQSHRYWVRLDDRRLGTVGLTHQAAAELIPMGDGMGDGL
jgi:hypothetical protein